MSKTQPKGYMNEVNIDIHFEADNFDPASGFDVALTQVLRDIEEILDNRISTEVDINVYITAEEERAL